MGFKKDSFNTGFNNNFNREYKSRSQAAMDALPEEERNQLDWRRNAILGGFILIVVIFIGVMALTGIGVDDDTQTGNLFAGESKVKIAFFGDSLTEGYSLDEDGQGYIVDTSYVDEALDEVTDAYPEIFLTFTNYGISGDIGESTSYERVGSQYSVVVVLYMVNNFIYGQEYEGILEANIEGLEESGAEVILLNYPVCEGSEYEETVKECNAYIAQAAESEEVSLFDAASYFEGLIEDETYTADELFASDGIHLSETGYKVLGNYVADILLAYETQQ